MACILTLLSHEPASMFYPKERDSDFHVRGLTASAFTDFLKDLLEKSLEAFSKEGYKQQIFPRDYILLAMNLIRAHFHYKKSYNKKPTKKGPSFKTATLIALSPSQLLRFPSPGILQSHQSPTSPPA